jgi:hypothetical protein
VTEEATKSRALRRNLALWLVAAVLLGIVAGFVLTLPSGNPWSFLMFVCSYVVIISVPRQAPRWPLLLAAGMVAHFISMAVTAYMYHEP